MVNFPAPVGGTPYQIDFAPSLIFAILYAALIPLMVYRMLSRRSRSLLLIGTIAFSLERVIIYAFRAVQARNESRRLSPGLATYMQVSFGMGFTGIANDIVNLVRCLLVNPTYGSDTFKQSAAAASKDGLMASPPTGTPDNQNLRQWVRRGAGIISLSFLGAIIPGIIANSNYYLTFTSQTQANSTAVLRYVSTAVTLVLTLSLLVATLLGKRYMPRICNRAVLLTCAITVLLSTIAIYRLAIMWQRTDALTAFNPLDTTGAKAAFYIFHVLPEWLVTLIILGDNARKTFGTGLFGDWRVRDESEKERQKREAKEAAKAAKAKKHMPQEC